MAKLVPPHGSAELKPLLLEGQALADEKKKAESLKKVPMTTRETSDLIMMGIGAFTPLDGFMGKDDWKGVCDSYQMPTMGSTVLAHPHHPVGGAGPGRLDQGRRGGRALGHRDRRPSWAP